MNSKLYFNGCREIAADFCRDANGGTKVRRYDCNFNGAAFTSMG